MNNALNEAETFEDIAKMIEETHRQNVALLSHVIGHMEMLQDSMSIAIEHIAQNSPDPDTIRTLRTSSIQEAMQRSCDVIQKLRSLPE